MQLLLEHEEPFLAVITERPHNLDTTTAENFKTMKLTQNVA